MTKVTKQVGGVEGSESKAGYFINLTVNWNFKGNGGWLEMGNVRVLGGGGTEDSFQCTIRNICEQAKMRELRSGR